MPNVEIPIPTWGIEKPGTLRLGETQFRIVLSESGLYISLLQEERTIELRKLAELEVLKSAGVSRWKLLCELGVLQS